MYNFANYRAALLPERVFAKIKNNNLRQHFKSIFHNFVSSRSHFFHLMLSHISCPQLHLIINNSSFFIFFLQ